MHTDSTSPSPNGTAVMLMLSWLFTFLSWLGKFVVTQDLPFILSCLASITVILKNVLPPAKKSLKDKEDKEET